MKNIEKIISETEFLVQRKTGGWDGYNVYLRHKTWSKKSFFTKSNKKPRLTAKLKRDLVERAIKDYEAEHHNYKIWCEINSRTNCVNNALESAMWELLVSNEKAYKLVVDCLESQCEYLEINDFLQVLLNTKCIIDEYNELRSLIIQRPSRQIK